MNILPVELEEQILLKLPVKSLLRFKQVCRRWGMHISTYQFAMSHFKSFARHHRILLTMQNDNQIQTLSLETPLQNPPAIINLPTDNPQYILCSCMGLLLVKICDSAGDDLDEGLVWNPTTGFRMIPEINFNYPGLLVHVLIGFGYAQHKDDFLIVMIDLCDGVDIGRNQVSTFSLKDSSSEENIDMGDIAYRCYTLSKSTYIGLFLGTSLYWLVRKVATDLPVVLAFEMESMTYTEIALSPALAEQFASYDFCLRVLGEKLCMCHCGFLGHASEIWVMTEAFGGWVKTFVLTVDEIPGTHFDPIEFNGVWESIGNGVNPVGAFVGSNGFFGSNCNGTLLKFNEQKIQVEERTYGRPVLDDCFVVYTESLLSIPLPPPQDMEQVP